MPQTVASRGVGIWVALALAVPLVCERLAGRSDGSLAIFLTVVVLWFTELLPLAVTGLLVPVLAVLYGALDVQQAFAPFGNQILFLFVGSFFLAKAMQKHGWDRRLVYMILSRRTFFRSLSSVCWTVSGVSFALSMWISNTAACAIVAPLAVGIVETLRDALPSSEDAERFSTRLLLTAAFGASIGGIATPVGSPPNLLAIQFLAQEGVHIEFLDWMVFGLPIALLMLIALQALMSLKFRLPDVHVEDVSNVFRQRLDAMGALSAAQLQVGLCFGLAIVLWLLPGLGKAVLADAAAASLLSRSLPMGVVALLCSVLLFCLSYRSGEHRQRNLVWDDVRSIDWGTILLFGGGLCMGRVLMGSGLAEQMGRLAFANVGTSLLIAGSAAVAFSIVMSELSSNTASTSIVVPVLLASFGTAAPEVILPLVVAAAVGASYGFMLPVSTPPNAIVYGTGRVKLRDMIQTGLLFDLTGCALICFFLLWLFPALGVF